VDLLSAIKMENIKVKGILLNNPSINAYILEDGTANYDIAPVSEETPEEEVDTSSSGSMDMTVALKKFEIRSANLLYDDKSQGMTVSLEDFNFLLTGDLSEDFTSIEINSTTEKVNVLMDGIRYVKDALLSIVIDVDADMANSVFTLGENSIGINDLALKFGGVVRMPDEETIDVDMSFETTKTQFKSLLSMVPAVFMSDFAGLEADGSLGLSGKITGSMKGEQTPSADVELVVENAMFNYPDLPKSADNININIKAHYDGVDNDNTVLDINQFHVELGGNPIDFTMNLITPMSDPQVSAQLIAKVDFNSLSDVIPLEDTDISGFLDAEVSMMGRMSSIEEERYEEFQADGRITLTDFDFNSPDVPVPVSISKTTILFSPKFLELQEFYLLIGASDLSLKGKVENFIPFVFDDGIISGKIAKTLLIEMIQTGKAPAQLVKDKGLEQISDAGTIEKAVAEAIAENPGIVNDFKGGKQNAIMALMGKVMAKTKGKANPKKVNEALMKRLKGDV